MTAPELPVSQRLRIPVLYQWIGTVAVGVVVAVLGGAGLSGLLAGHGWAARGHLWRALNGWWAHPGSPAAGWPYDPRPGPAWLVYTLVVLIAAAQISGWWMIARWRTRHRSQGAAPGMARTRDVAGRIDEAGAKAHAVGLRPSLAGRNIDDLPARELVHVLGVNTADDKPIALRQNDSLLVFGGSGSGKTWRVAITPILTAPGFLVVTSTKADVLRATCWARAQQGRVAVFDPEDIARGWPDKIRWSLIAGCEDPDTAIRRAEGVISGQSGDRGASSEGAVFYKARAATVLQCYLYAAAVGGRRMSDVRRWAATMRNAEVRDILEHHLPEWATDYAKATDSGDPRTDGNTMATVAAALKPLASPRLMTAIDVEETESLDLATFVTGPNTLYLLSEGTGGGQSIAPYASALLNEVHYLAKQHAQCLADQRLDPPARMVLDEVANVAPMPGLEAKLTDSGGRGIQMEVMAHGSDQLKARFGATQAGQILDAPSALMFLPGLMDAELLELASTLLGRVEAWRPGRTPSSAPQAYERLVMSPHEIRTMAEGQALLIYRDQRGILLRIRAYWEGDPDQADLVERSIAHYDHMIAPFDTGNGNRPPLLDQVDGTELGAPAVLDLTKGWRR